MAGKSSSNKKGNRKYDRNRPWCEAYRKRNQRERNQLRGLRKHSARFPKDACAARAIERCTAALGVRLAAE